MTQKVNHLLETMLVEQPLAFPRSAKYKYLEKKVYTFH